MLRKEEEVIYLYCGVICKFMGLCNFFFLVYKFKSEMKLGIKINVMDLIGVYYKERVNRECYGKLFKILWKINKVWDGNMGWDLRF